jgi:hypothetical protein
VKADILALVMCAVAVVAIAIDAHDRADLALANRLLHTCSGKVTQ